MLVLDLWGEHSPQWRRFGGFRGKRWLWCALHNFGGRSDLFGSLRTTHEEFEAALLAARTADRHRAGDGGDRTEPDRLRDDARSRVRADRRPRIVGSRASDPALRARGSAGGVGLGPTAHDGVRRPGRIAWSRARTRGCVTTRPSVALRARRALQLRTLVDAPRWYDEAELSRHGRDLSEGAERHPDALAGELGHDLVSVAATALSRACDRLVVEVVTAWPRSSDELVAAGDRFLAALDDLDGLLSTRPEFRWSRGSRGGNRARS